MNLSAIMYHCYRYTRKHQQGYKYDDTTISKKLE